jgi:hypothetical protein
LAGEREVKGTMVTTREGLAVLVICWQTIQVLLQSIEPIMLLEKQGGL